MNNVTNRFGIRDKILELENIIRDNCVNIVNGLTVKHYHSGGIYAREMTIPAGVVVTGAIHKFDHMATITKGRGFLVDEFGGMREFIAPITIESKKGVKRALYALEETVFTTYHICDEKEEAKIWKKLVCKTYVEYNKLERCANNTLIEGAI